MSSNHNNHSELAGMKLDSLVRSMAISINEDPLYAEFLAQDVAKKALEVIGSQGYPIERGFKLWQSPIFNLVWTTIERSSSVYDFLSSRNLVEKTKQFVLEALTEIIGSDPREIPKHILLFRYLIAKRVTISTDRQEIEPWFSIKKGWIREIKKLQKSGLIESDFSEKYPKLRLSVDVADHIVNLIRSWEQTNGELLDFIGKYDTKMKP